MTDETSAESEVAPESVAAPAGSRRDQILTAAARLFARYGFHGVGIDDIGNAVGVSGPALYRHFRGKDAMLAEMLTGISEQLLSGGRCRADSADAQAALGALVRWHVDFSLANPDLITVHTRDLHSLAPTTRHRVRETQRDYVEVWVSMLVAAREDLDEPTARAAAHAVLALINSTPHSAHLDGAAMRALLQRMALDALALDR